MELAIGGFRSTGSYEPDLAISNSIQALYEGFDPQALTSLTDVSERWAHVAHGFDPQALTSLTGMQAVRILHGACFDPQALTSLTIFFQCGLF